MPSMMGLFVEHAYVFLVFFFLGEFVVLVVFDGLIPEKGVEVDSLDVLAVFEFVVDVVLVLF